MSNVAIIPKFDLPAAILDQFSALNGADDLDSGVSGGFPVMSIKGAKWRIVEGGEEHPIYMPGTTDLAPYVKVVILRANPAISKTYYEGQFVEGTDQKPDCYSNDGIVPASDAVNPQSPSCASCPHNAWGSKISPSGAKIKACADVRRIAILPSEDMSYSPILLRIPGASLGDLAQYGKALKQRNIPYAAVVTKLSFDPDAAFPKILFRFDSVLNAEQLALVAERMTDPVVEDVLGLSPPRHDAPALAAPADDKFGIPADVGAPEQPAAEPEQAAPATKAAPKPRAAAKAKVEEPATPVPEAEPETSGSMSADIEAALAGIQM